MQFDQPDNLSQALLITDGTTRGLFDESPHLTGRFITSTILHKLMLPKIFQTDNNNNNHVTRVMITCPVDINDLRGRGRRLGFCCASTLLLVYAIAIACSALDKILDLHIFPESTLVLLVGSVVVVYLVIGLYVSMPTIVAFLEIINYERSVLLGTPP
jgi:uncharacterized membrane protein (DUF485 family)